jgi:metallo-beta-lactamase family protein
MNAAGHLTHLGGQNTITGSCHLLQAHGLSILIDCGLAQGSDHVPPISSWPITPGQVDFLFLTHAHIDHIGRVPELIRLGFKGEILCTHPTRFGVPVDWCLGIIFYITVFCRPISIMDL